MRHADEPSIFERYYRAESFVDCFLPQRDQSVDGIIPIIHTNDFRHFNLIHLSGDPVNRLLFLGYGGCIIGSLDVAREFLRVSTRISTPLISGWPTRTRPWPRSPEGTLRWRDVRVELSRAERCELTAMLSKGKRAT
jgi:hypothetical protein